MLSCSSSGSRVRQPLNFRVAHAFDFEAWGFSALRFAFRIAMSSNQPLIILPLIAIRSDSRKRTAGHKSFSFDTD
jgi:hypothetical protein